MIEYDLCFVNAFPMENFLSSIKGFSEFLLMFDIGFCLVNDYQIDIGEQSLALEV